MPVAGIAFSRTWGAADMTATDPAIRDALRALNNAAYAAARAAGKAQHPFALELRQIALRSDEMVDATALVLEGSL